MFCFFFSKSLNTGKNDRNVNNTRKVLLLGLAGVWVKVTVPRSLYMVGAGAGDSVHGCSGRRARDWMLGMAMVLHFSLTPQGLPASLERPCRFLPANLESFL